MVQDSQLLFGAYQEASKKLQAMARDGIDKDQQFDAKFLSGIVTNYTRLCAVENNNKQIASTISLNFARDKDEYRELVRSNVPEFKETKVIGISEEFKKLNKE